MKKKYAYLAVLLLAVCLTMGLVVFGMKGAKEANTTEPPTEAPSEAPTEAPTTAPTEAPTEAPSEAPTEAPTEVPTEPSTEAPTEPEIEIAIKARDTMLEGTPVEFDVVTSDFGGLQFEKLNPMMMIAPIKNGSEYDYKRGFCIITARSLEEFNANFSSLIRPGYYDMFPEAVQKKMLEKYNTTYFEKQAVFILCQGSDVDEVVKNGTELCIGASTRLKKPDDILPDVARFYVRFIEVNKADLNGIDTISFFVKAQNVQ